MIIKKHRALTTQSKTVRNATPAILLFISVSAIAPVRAEQRDSSQGHLLKPAPVRANENTNSNVTITDHSSDALILPFDLVDQQDSDLFRRLLLTHGVTLDLGESHAMTGTAIVRLIDSIRSGDALNQEVDPELLPVEAFSLTSKLDWAQVLADSSFEADLFIDDVSRDWRVQWWGKTAGSSKLFVKNQVQHSTHQTGILREQSALLQAEDAPHKDDILDLALQERAGSALVVKIFTDQGESVVENSVSSAWRVQTRPATASELLLLGFTPRVSEHTPTSSQAVDIDLGSGPVAEALEPNTNTDSVPLPGAETNINTDVEIFDDKESGGQGIFAIADEIPPGFEDLAFEQTAFVNVYFKERKIGTVSITSSAEEFTFDNPADVLGMIDGIEDPEALRKPLSQALRTNADKICYGLDDPAGCGIVEANPIAAIYNENELKLELFVAPGLQSIESQSKVKYLPEPEKNNTSILSVYAVASDLEGQGSAIDLSGRALFGYGNGNITAEADYNTRTNAQRLRELKLTHFVSDYELVAGTYSFQPGGALTGFNMLGFSFATTFRTRVDLEHAFSTEMVVYLPRRSVVQIVVDDRVYTGASYAAGNQVLDTAALPDGTYEVELRILDPVSGSRSERRVFTKSALIPPRGQTVFNVTTGIPIVFKDSSAFADPTNTKVLGFSVSNRWNDRSAIRLGSLQFGPYSFAQTDIVYLGKRVSLQLSVSAGEEKTVASAMRVSYFYKNLSFSLSGDLFVSDIDRSEVTLPEYELLFPNDYKQVNFSINQTFKNHSVGVRSGYRNEKTLFGKQNSNQYALYYRRPLFRRRGLRGFLDAGYQQDELEKRLTLQFRMYFGGDQWSTLVGSALGKNDDGKFGHLISVDAARHTELTNHFDLDTGVYANTGSDGQAAGVNLSLEHPWFTAGAASDMHRGDEGQQTRNSVATVSAHLGVDRRGIGMGGSDFAQAGVIVSVKGEPAGTRFDILVNGIKISTGQIGKTQFIGLQPFEAYSIKLIPQSVLSNGLGEDIYEFTLYPGTVQRIDIVAERKVLLIATLVDDNGDIIENAVVERDKNPMLIDASGFFQSEVSPGESLRVKMSQGRECEFSVPEDVKDEVLVINDPMHCQEIILDD